MIFQFTLETRVADAPIQIVVITMNAKSELDANRYMEEFIAAHLPHMYATEMVEK